MPLSELAAGIRVVGIRAVRKALFSGCLEKLFIADDARPALVAELENDAKKAGVEVERAPDMIRLGRACAIDRGAAAAGIRKC